MLNISFIIFKSILMESRDLPVEEVIPQCFAHFNIFIL